MFSLLEPVHTGIDLVSAKDYGWLGGYIDIHTDDYQPEIKEADIIIIGVPVEDFAIDNEGTKYAPDEIRKSLYQLYPGKWQQKIVDLGNIKTGDNTEENRNNLINIAEQILFNNQSLIIIGGSHDVTCSLAKIYDKYNKTYNLSVIDAIIDSVLSDNQTDNNNFITELLVNDKSLLRNLSLIGIQTYYNHPSKFEIFNKLFVDYYKLGDVKRDIYEVEPELREAHITSIDVGAIRNADMPAQKNAHPNGLDGQEICTLTRLAGLSVNNRIMGIFEYNPFYDKNHTGANLIAQMIWYYIEGKNVYQEDYPNIDKKELIKFIVDNDVIKLNFYKNPKTERWWVEIPDLDKKNKLFSCTEKDYHSSLNSVMGKRIYKIINKMSI